ncbi:MAG: RidA family protein [Acidobacteria bacterium]|nr:RidA family protein [Acidobacteriota bacterium]
MNNNLELINPPELGRHSGYSQGVKTQAGPLLFIAGQVAWDEQSRIVSPDFTAQFSKALSNVLAVIRAAGGQPESLVRLTIYVRDRNEYVAHAKKIGEAYRQQMGKHFPAMTLVEVKGLFEEGAQLELEATAAL